MKVTFHSLKSITIPAAFIADKMSSAVNLPANFEANIIGITSDEIKSMNKQFRKIDEPTDVLSFESEIKDEPGGDIYLCLEVIQDNAKRFNITFEEEIVRTIVHGILHLAGYDHERKLGESNEQMFEIQEKIIKDIFQTQ